MLAALVLGVACSTTLVSVAIIAARERRRAVDAWEDRARLALRNAHQLAGPDEDVATLSSARLTLAALNAAEPARDSPLADEVRRRLREIEERLRKAREARSTGPR